MLEVVTWDEQAIEHAAAELPPDHEIVLEVVKQDERTIEYAAAELLPDHEIVLES